jgi:hypothetical protein
MEPQNDTPAREPSRAPEAFLKPYNPAEREPETLALWEAADYANPDTMVKKGLISADAQPYSIVLPPSKITYIPFFFSFLYTSAKTCSFLLLWQSDSILKIRSMLLSVYLLKL